MGFDLWTLAQAGDAEGILARVNETDDDVNVKDNLWGRTPLWIAAAQGHIETVKLLVSLRADVQIKCEGRTALQIAMKKSQPAVAYYLKCQRDYFPKIQQGPNQPRRVALLIGQERYESLEIVPHATSDVHVVARRLAAMKFETFVRTNLTGLQLMENFDRFAQDLGVGDFAVFYFVGLGCRQANRSLLYGVDKRFMLIPDQEKLSLETVVESLLTRTGTKTKKDLEFKADLARRRRIAGIRGPSLVIVDACRSVKRTGYTSTKFGHAQKVDSMLDPMDTQLASTAGSDTGLNDTHKPRSLSPSKHNSAAVKTGSSGFGHTGIEGKTNIVSGREKANQPPRQELLTGQRQPSELAVEKSLKKNNPLHGENYPNGATREGEFRRSFPSNYGVQDGPTGYKYLNHYPGTRENGKEQERLWQDLQERQREFAQPKGVVFNSNENPGFGVTVAMNTTHGSSQESHLVRDTPSNGYNNTGQFNKTTKFAQGVGTRSGGMSKTDQNFFNSAMQHDTQDIHGYSRHHISDIHGQSGHHVSGFENSRHDLRSLQPQPGIAESTDGYNLMMESTGRWKPAETPLNPTQKMWEKNETLFGGPSSVASPGGGAKFGSDASGWIEADTLRGLNQTRPQVAPDYARLDPSDEARLFQPLNPSNARSEQERIEDQDYGFALLQNKELNDIAVPCKWFKDSFAQVETWMRGPTNKLGVLNTRDAAERGLTSNTSLRYRTFADDPNYRTGTGRESELSRTGESMLQRARAGVQHSRSCTDFKNLVTKDQLNKRGVDRRQYGRFDGPTADELEYADKYCVGEVQPVNRVHNPGLHAQDLEGEERIAILFSNTPTEVVDEDFPCDLTNYRMPLFPGADESPASGMKPFELSMRNALSRRVVMEIHDAPWPGAVGWDANRSGYSNMTEYSARVPSLFGASVEQALVHNYKLRDALKTAVVRVMKESNRVLKPCLQEKQMDICL